MNWTALVLAGSRPGRDPFAESHGTDLKALIPVGGVAMVARPVAALLAAREIDAVRVLIVGQDPYPTPGHPIGLSFAVDPHVRPVPRSLSNIYREYSY